MDSIDNPFSTPTRRQVLKGLSAVGAGLVLGVYLPPRRAVAQMPPGKPPNTAPNTFVSISPDNIVTMLSKHTEMGQGVYTGLATAFAEELDADWQQIRVEAAPANFALYGHPFLQMQGTGGSSSIPSAYMQMRMVGARARAMLVAAAAQRLDVPAADLTVANGVITHAASGRKLSFGEVSVAAAALTPPDNVPLKDPRNFKLIGTRIPKVDSVAKSNGTAMFTMDVYKPDMLYALVAHSPRFGGRLKSFDATATRKVRGVVDVVEIPRGVAVLAEGMYAASRGRDALQVQWDDSAAEMRGSEEIIADYTSQCDQPGRDVERSGDADAAFAAAARTFEATYIFPYLAHAPMEPLDIVIEREGDNYRITSGTQMPSMDQSRAARVLGVAPERVFVTNMFAGGGFGRRGNFVPDMDAEAASLLQATDGKRPIKLVYTREDDMTGGFYRPLFVHRIRAAIDAQGNITAWTNRLVGQSFLVGSMFDGMFGPPGSDPIAFEGAGDLPYKIPNVTVDGHIAKAGVTTLAWRSVGHTHTAYSKETFLDELLHAGGHDPVEWRLANMKDARERAVLALAADKAGWGKPLPEGHALGVAFVKSFGTSVAEIAQVSLNSDGTPKIERVVAAVDCGLAVNPDIVRAQVEGAIGYGLSAALFGEVNIEKGIPVTRNFHNYRVLRMDEMPAVEVHIVASTEPPSGIGEPGLPPIAPAVANAYFKLTGKRVYRLPMVRA